MTAIRLALPAIALAFASAAAPHAFSAAASSRPESETEECIAIAPPVVQGVAGNADEASSGLRDLLAKYLTGPSLKVVPLDARLPSQAAAEAKEKGCDPVLFATLTRKGAGSKLTTALGQAAGGSGWYLPGGGSIGSTIAHVAASTGLQTVASLAASTKAKDEMRFDYRLQSAAGQVQFGPKTEHQRASLDGEDLLTPVVMRAADAIVTRKPASK